MCFVDQSQANGRVILPLPIHLPPKSPPLMEKAFVALLKSPPVDLYFINQGIAIRIGRNPW